VVQEGGLRLAQVDAVQGAAEMPVGSVEQEHTSRLGRASDISWDAGRP
jgi:hypothetical protein